MGAKLLIDALQVGLQGMLAWHGYQAKLLERQQQRAAEGREITQEDIDEILADTHNKLASNRATLEAAKAAQDAS
jgi:transcriptional regulator NrdR family protein